VDSPGNYPGNYPGGLRRPIVAIDLPGEGDCPDLRSGTQLGGTRVGGTQVVNVGRSR